MSRAPESAPKKLSCGLPPELLLSSIAGRWDFTPLPWVLNELATLLGATISKGAIPVQVSIIPVLELSMRSKVVGLHSHAGDPGDISEMLRPSH